MEPLVDDFIATLWVGKAIIAVPTFEAGISWLLPIFDTSEESLHSLIETLEYILLYLAMDILILFSQRFESRKLIGLRAIGNRHPIHPVCFTPLLKTIILKFLASP